MKVSDLVEDDWAVNDSWPVNFVQLLDCVLFVEVEAKDAVELFTVFAQTTDKKNFSG